MTYKGLNIYEYLKIKMQETLKEIGEILLEGDTYFTEWEAISKLSSAIINFLSFVSKNKVELEKEYDSVEEAES